jgi:tetratricopeptide (TPR) repeat protein
MKKNISLLIGFMIPLLVSIILLAYDNKEMHPKFNERIVDHFTTYFSSAYGFPISYSFEMSDEKYFGKKIINTGLFNVDEADEYLTAKEWISHGGFSADEPEVDASLRHFYDPFAVSGATYLTDLVDGIVGSYAITNPKMDAKEWALTARDNEYNFNKAKEYLKRALETSDNIERLEYFGYAYRALGETLHLLVDMGCPSHVRNDAHPAYLASGDNLYGDADPYEELVGIVSDIAFLNPKEIPELTELFREANTLDRLFDLLAVFTSNYFFSDDTQYGSGVMPNNGQAPFQFPQFGVDVFLNQSDNFYYTNVGGHNIKMSEAKSYFFGGKYPKITYECVKDQAEVLLPAVVEAGANAIKLFMPKFSVSILAADDEGKLEGRITHQKTEVWTEEINYTGPIEIYDGENLLHTINAIGGVFSEQNISLTAGTSIKAKTKSGGIIVESSSFSVVEKTDDPDCLAEMKARKYVGSEIRIDCEFSDGTFTSSYGTTEHVPNANSILSVPPNYHVSHNSADYPEVSWSGNTFSVEKTIVTMHDQAVYVNATTPDTVYFRIEGTISQDGRQVLGAYVYWKESATTYSSPNGYFMNKKEKIVSYRISNLPNTLRNLPGSNVTGCSSFYFDDPVKAQQAVSDVVLSEKDIDYVEDTQNGGYKIYEVKKDRSISNIRNLPYIRLSFANMPF